MHKLARRADKPNPKLVEYLKKNGLSFKKLSEISDEHEKINGITDEPEFWDRYYKSGMDAFHESADYPLNMETFGLMAEMVRQKAKVFEPCCRSGYFGAWLVSSKRDIDYIGMDINPFAIQKAREVAFSNVVDPHCFIEGDYRRHSGMYDFVIGRNITNIGDFGIDLSAIKKITSIADEIVMLHFTYENKAAHDLMNLELFFKMYNFIFEQASRPFGTSTGGSGAVAFVYRAYKKPDY